MVIAIKDGDKFKINTIVYPTAGKPAITTFLLRRHHK
jgi:hypothetical protein